MEGVDKRCNSWPTVRNTGPASRFALQATRVTGHGAVTDCSASEPLHLEICKVFCHMMICLMTSCGILFAEGPIANGQAAETAKQTACRITAISFSLVLNLPWWIVVLKTWQNKKAKKEKLIPLSELFRVLGK